MTRPFLKSEKNEGRKYAVAGLFILITLVFGVFVLYLASCGVLFAVNTLFGTDYPLDVRHALSVVILVAVLCGIFSVRSSTR